VLCRWVPPPLPPPSGLATLGPSELRAVAGCRHLRRLELDVSLRSAALGVAAVQLVAQSCPNLEVRVKRLSGACAVASFASGETCAAVKRSRL
jgi:hypothetical protein